MKRIAIHSAPRSGSTWLGTLFDAHPSILYKYQPLFSYEFKDRLNESSRLEEINHFYQELSQSTSEFLDQGMAKRRGIVPLFKKEELEAIAYKEVRYHHILENLLKKDEEIKVIGLIRDPRAVMYSWWKAPREFNQNDWDFNEEWLFAEKKNEGKIENFYGFQKWKEVASLFLELAKQHPQQFLLLEYENLLRRTREAVEQLMLFCGLDLHEQQINFINKSGEHHASDAYAVYKVKSDDHSWQIGLPKNVIDAIESDLKGTVLEQFLK